MSKKFLELKSLAITYKENKDIEINDLNLEINKFKDTIEKYNESYELMLNKTTKSLEKIIHSAESKSKVQ